MNNFNDTQLKAAGIIKGKEDESIEQIVNFFISNHSEITEENCYDTLYSWRLLSRNNEMSISKKAFNYGFYYKWEIYNKKLTKVVCASKNGKQFILDLLKDNLLRQLD